MSSASGRILRYAARALHLIMVAVVGLLLVVSMLLAGVALRLSMGPINANWASTVPGDLFIIDSTVGLSFDGVRLAWEGFHRGVGFSFDLQLLNITLIDPQQHRLLSARQAVLSLSPAALLRGHLVPRSLELDDGLVTLTRERGGSFNLGLTSEHAAGGGSDPTNQAADVRWILMELIHPAEVNNGSDAAQLSHVRLRNFGLIVRDEQLGLTWQASGGELDVTRHQSGLVVGSAHVPVVLGDQHADITLGVNLPRDASGQIEATLSVIQPATVAKFAAVLPFIAAVNAPVSLHATVQLDPDLVAVSGRAEAKLGAGSLRVGSGQVTVRDGVVAVSATPDRLVIEDARLSLPSSKAGTSPEVSLHGFVQRQAERLMASVAVAVDHLDVADLAEVWPDGVASGARPWILQNVTTGTVAHSSGTFVAEASTDLHDVVITRASGDLDADNVSITWLDQVPPVERAQLHLHLMDPDKLVILASSGHQHIGKGGADLLVQDGQMEITGLSVRDQDMKIRLHAAGPVASAITLLKEPRLHLLSKESIDLQEPGGDVTAMLSLQFPLEKRLQADEIAFHASARLISVRIAKIIAGRDLRDGDFDLTADKDGLGIKGRGTLAGIPVMLIGSMDFTTGPGSQVVRRITASGQPDVAGLAAVGIDLKDIISSGPISLTAVLLQRRNGEGSIMLNADLAATALEFKPLAWTKRVGEPSVASATLLMSHDRLAAVPRIAITSKTLLLTASAECAEGAVRVVSIDHARFGKTNMQGSIHLPVDGPIGVVLSGPEVDLSPRLSEDPSPSQGATNEAPTKGFDWTLTAQFHHASLANDQGAEGLSVRARTSNGSLHELDLAGSISSNSAFSVQINPASGARRLNVEAADAGVFLQAVGLTRGLRSGRLTINGEFDDKLPTHPLVGTARIENSRLVNAPALGKVLQGMTLYGLANLLSGPGIGVSQIVVPFRYDQKHLQIIDARIFSASLGLTAMGLVDLSTHRVAITGTIVPAYVFNSVLGYIPFVGKLFSPEVGGGLFAARYKIDGPFGDTTTSVYPLSILTPGFLRNLFSM